MCLRCLGFLGFGGLVFRDLGLGFQGIGIRVQGLGHRG